MILLYYKWGSNSDDILIPYLQSRGYDLTFISTKCKDYTRDMSLAQEFIFKINEIGAEAVFSWDYFPILGMVCDTCKIPYYSWVYDSPHFTLYAKTTSLKCNNIGVFDRGLVEYLKELGIRNVFYKPLAVDPDFFATSISKCKKDYSCDISFVGSLYTDEHEYYEMLKNESLKIDSNLLDNGTEKELGFFRKSCENPEESEVKNIWEYLDKLTLAQTFEYERNFIGENLSYDTDMRKESDIVNYLYGLMEQHGITLGDDYIQDKTGLVYDAILAKHVTVLERRRMLESIALMAKDRGYDFRIYTGSIIPQSSNLEFPAKQGGGYIDYIGQMPSAFNKSRVNINITLRSIRTGIPLRALDIMACGGFLLTDPQEELFEYFTEGEDFEAYRSVEECLDKISFYLTHDDIRKKIAERGYNACRSNFTFESIE